MDPAVIQKIAIWIIPVLFAVTLHEVAHGWTARWLGDPTAHLLGRLSLNPIRHIDPLGTILLPLFMVMTIGFVFGYARPVPVNWLNLRRPKRDMAIVAAAGPAANLLMTLVWLLVLKTGLLLNMPSISPFLVAMGLAGVFINLVLMLLNLLPLPPLDGGRVLAGLLPDPIAEKYGRIEPFGLIILVVLLVSGLLGYIIGPPINYLFVWMADLVGMTFEQFVQFRHMIGLSGL